MIFIYFCYSLSGTLNEDVIAEIRDKKKPYLEVSSSNPTRETILFCIVGFLLFLLYYIDLEYETDKSFNKSLKVIVIILILIVFYNMLYLMNISVITSHD